MINRVGLIIVAGLLTSGCVYSGPAVYTPYPAPAYTVRPYYHYRPYCRNHVDYTVIRGYNHTRTVRTVRTRCY